MNDELFGNWTEDDQDEAVPGVRAVLLRAGLAGLLIAAVLAPVVVPASLVARQVTTSFDALPAELPDVPLPQQSRMLAADGTVLATLFSENRRVVALQDVSQHARNAVLAIEDARFYQHNGVDARGIVRALINNRQAGEVEQGASTLTQQYVKNALLLSATNDEERAAAAGRSYTRKVREARLALAVEASHTKDEILEKYLNIAYFASGAYGIESAAHRYFGKSADELEIAEAALLAGIVKNPSRFDPLRNPNDAKARRNIVLSRMHELGYIDASQHAKARASALELNPARVPNGCEASPAPFFCDYVRTLMLTDEQYGRTAEEREARLRQGGLVIRTTLDMKAQKAAQEAADGTIPRTDRVATAVVVLVPGSGAVAAMAVNRTYGKGENQTEVPLAVRPAYQPGSTFKAVTLAAAIEQGIPTTLRLAGGERYTSRVFDNPGRGYYSNAADGEGGTTDLATATALSINTYYVRLLEKVGVHNTADMAERLGITSIPRSGPRAVHPREGAFTLGTREVSPLEMAVAYATFASRGIRCRPWPVAAMVRLDGSDSAQMPRDCVRVLKPEVADSVNAVLQGVVTRGTGRQNATLDRPSAGKTGTTQDYGAAWYVGYTPDLAAAVWVGDPRGPAYPLRNVQGVSRVFGGTLPAKIWKKAMLSAHEGSAPRAFVAPDPAAALSAQAHVPDVSGMDVQQARQVLAAAGLRPRESSAAPTSIVAGTSPAAGTGTGLNTEVTLNVESSQP